MVVELLGPMLALAYGGAFLRNTAATFFIDNMSGLCAMVKGGSTRSDLAGLANGMAVGLVEKDCRAWMDFVESESNSSDGGSRVGITDSLAKDLGVQLIQLELPPLPKGFPYCKPSVWTSWWARIEEDSVALWR